MVKAKLRGTNGEKQDLEDAVVRFGARSVMREQSTLDYWLWMRREFRPGGYWARSEYTGRRRKKGEKV